MTEYKASIEAATTEQLVAYHGFLVRRVSDPPPYSNAILDDMLGHEAERILQKIYARG